jgi:hypothetical protein
VISPPSLGSILDTVRIRFHTQLSGAAIKANAKMAESLFRKATGEGRVPAIFWFKTRAKWSEGIGAVDHRLTHEEALELA